MNLPESVRVGSIDYKVESTKKLFTNNGVYGRISYGDALIRIEDSLSLSKKREVLAHEIVHGMLIEANYEDHEEEQAISIGKILAVLLRDNDFTFMRDSSEIKDNSVERKDPLNNINYE